MPTTSFRNQTLWMDSVKATHVPFDPPPQKQPFFYSFTTYGVIPNYIQYCLEIYVSAVIFFVFCCSLLYSVLCLSDSSLSIFVTLVHSFELLYSISLHEDTIIYLSPILTIGIYSLSLIDTATTNICIHILLHRSFQHCFCFCFYTGNEFFLVRSHLVGFSFFHCHHKIELHLL